MELHQDKSYDKIALRVFHAAVCVLVAAAALFFWRFCGAPADSHSYVRFVSSREAYELIALNPDAPVIDVRFPAEFAARRVPGAVNIPLGSNLELANLPENPAALVFVYCNTGRRAANTANELLALGFTDIVVFPGMRDWEGATESDSSTD